MAQVFYCQYTAEGEIVSSGRTSEGSIGELAEDGLTLLVTADEVNVGQDYFDVTTQTVLPMTAITTTTELSADTNAVVTLSGLPDCTATYYLGAYNPEPLDTPNIIINTDTVADGQLDISADLAGTYTIVLTAPTSLESVVTFTVEDA